MGVFLRKDRRLRAGWRVGFYLILYLVGMLVLQAVVLGAYTTLILVQGRETLPEWTERLIALDLPLWLWIALKAVDLLWILLLTWAFGRFLDRRTLAGFGLRRTRGWLQDAALGLALGALQMALIVGIASLAGTIEVAALPEPALGLRIRDAALGLVFFVLVAVGEELLFRGYVQTNLQEGRTSVGQAAPPAVALGVSALLFGLLHALNPNLTWIAMLNLILAGVAFGVGYWATGTLWLPIAYHLSWNFVQGSILGLPVSGMRYGGLVLIADWGKLPWLTGHTFGPEGGLLATLMLLATVGLFRWWGEKAGKG